MSARNHIYNKPYILILSLIITGLDTKPPVYFNFENSLFESDDTKRSFKTTIKP